MQQLAMTSNGVCEHGSQGLNSQSDGLTSALPIEADLTPRIELAMHHLRASTPKSKDHADSKLSRL